MKLSKTDIRSIGQMYKNLDEKIIVDKKILDSIDNEKSIIGKQLLIGDQLQVVMKKVSNKGAKNQLIFYLVRLFNYNTQVYESLKLELKNDGKLLGNRVKNGFQKKDIHKEMCKNILKIANKHFNIGKQHLKGFNPQDKSTHRHGHMAMHHKVKAEGLYDTLVSKDIKQVIKRLALVKLTNTYKKMITRCGEIASLIVKTLKTVKKSNQLKLYIHEINRYIAEQNLALRHFAINYSKSLIHAAEYIDNLNNKIILYTHR